MVIDERCFIAPKLHFSVSNEAPVSEVLNIEDD